MRTVALPDLDTARAWRDAARALVAESVPPEEVQWTCGAPEQTDLFQATGPGREADGAARTRSRRQASVSFNVPKSFVDLAETVAWHSDPERFARLYAFLWRLRDRPVLIHDRGDAALAKLRAMEKEVNRDKHKMKAFLRFREIGAPDAPRRRFAAWFEPSHNVTEPLATFFARRFGDMDWLILTPRRTARFERGEISFAPGQPKPPLPEDATEDLWTTYFRSIFNPARLKVKAMQAEMPKKYWKNMPEAAAIPGLIAQAESRARAMQEAAPTLPPLRAGRIRERLHAPGVLRPMGLTFDDLRRKAEDETRTARDGYGRVVLGEGPHDAPLMVVGEQPGDVEDREGRPFVGPSGQLFDNVAEEAGLDRKAAYVTNAVKQFRYVQRGKRRIHQSPDRSDIEHGRWWLDAEIKLVKPTLILSMGGTAAETLTGTRKGILKRRGHVEETEHGPVFLTVHPSYILRIPDAARKAKETDLFRADLAAAQAHLEELRAA